VNYFTEDEFKCNCGCGLDATKETKELAGDMRSIAGIPFVITSGARCLSYNRKIGSSDNSAHVTGEAFDVKYSSGQDAYKIERAAYLSNVKRIGRNRVSKFFHIDVSKTLPQNVSFDY
jgi:zinc D-Ala-D-Ala carboxypeptidase